MTARVSEWPDGAGWYAECDTCREVWQRRDSVTALELRLRQRIDLLTDQRDEARAGVPRGRRLPLRCVYCGASRRRGSVACPAHSDLPRLDPYYARNVAA